jgi:hypothetical protein
MTCASCVGAWNSMALGKANLARPDETDRQADRVTRVTPHAICDRREALCDDGGPFRVDAKVFLDDVRSRSATLMCDSSRTVVSKIAWSHLRAV